MKPARIAVPDFVSNSYFPAIAAIELGCFAKHGLHAQHELIFPNYKAFEALRDDKIDFVAGPAHAVLPAFPQWRGAKLIAALAQGMYWLLVMRADLPVQPGDINCVKGRSIGAAPLVDQGLKRMLIESGIDLEHDQVNIIGVPGADAPGISFGMAAAQALASGQLDGFWANAMGAENAVRKGVGKVVLDVRRGVGPAFAFHYTMPVLVTSDRVIARDCEFVASAVRAVVDAQQALKADVTLATKIGRALFPPADAELIAATVERDLPFYDPAITELAITGVNRFATAIGLLDGPVPFEEVVALQFRNILNLLQPS
jgi:ABC-type nitrate/sulfonate/bicarbonate transport system substrate-binding protein